MTVKNLLKQKGNTVVTIHKDHNVKQAVEVLIRHNIGAIIVVDDQENPLGIVSERDILREVHHHGDVMEATPIQKIMTSELIIGLLGDSLDYVQCIFTKNRIRHLPIFDQGKMVGIISIGDVVKTRLKEQEVENHYLRNFIMDKYPG